MKLRISISNYKLLSLHMLLTVAIVISTLPLVGCGPDSVHKLKVDLDKAALTLNTAAKTNHALYAAHEISLAARQKVATAIYDANEALIVALDVAQPLNASTFQGGKAQILALLETAVSKLNISIGDPKIDLVLQSVIALINDAIILASAFTHSMLRDVVPVFREVARNSVWVETRELAREGVY